MKFEAAMVMRHHGRHENLSTSVRVGIEPYWICVMRSLYDGGWFFPEHIATNVQIRADTTKKIRCLPRKLHTALVNEPSHDS